MFHLLLHIQHLTTSPQVVYISIPSPCVKFSLKKLLENFFGLHHASHIVYGITIVPLWYWALGKLLSQKKKSPESIYAVSCVDLLKMSKEKFPSF